MSKTTPSLTHSQPIKTDTLLWEVTHPDSEHRSYLFGTIHLMLTLSEQERILRSIIYSRYFSQAEMLITESGDMGAEYYEFDSDTLAAYKAVESYGIDTNLMLAAKMYDKPILPLESADEFLFKKLQENQEKIENGSEKDSRAMQCAQGAFRVALFPVKVACTLRQLKKIEKVYVRGKVTDKVMQTNDEDTNDNTRQRNLTWVYSGYKHYDKAFVNFADDYHQRTHFPAVATQQSLKKLLKENNTFVAVGAAHLAGHSGLINLLRQEGYSVTPVTDWLELKEKPRQKCC